MKLLDSTIAPNPRRVRIYLAEKGLDVAREHVDISKGENRTAEFLAKNPLGKLPVLELDDGTYLAESLAICEYLEELHPQPPLIGRTPAERANTRMWDRRMELEVMRPILDAFVHSSPFFKERMEQCADYAEAARKHAGVRLEWLDGHLGTSRFVSGPEFTIADITLWCTLDFAEVVGEKYDPERCTSVARWHEEMRGRPSACA